MRCTAHKTRTGEPCRGHAVTGTTVCRAHGASAPQVKAAARARVREAKNLELARMGLLKPAADLSDPAKHRLEIVAELIGVRRVLSGMLASKEASEWSALLPAYGATTKLLLEALDRLPQLQPAAATGLDVSDAREKLLARLERLVRTPGQAEPPSDEDAVTGPSPNGASEPPRASQGPNASIDGLGPDEENGRKVVGQLRDWGFVPPTYGEDGRLICRHQMTSTDMTGLTTCLSCGGTWQRPKQEVRYR